MDRREMLKNVAWRGAATGACGAFIAIEGRAALKGQPYDPIAVLEAMRERFWVSIDGTTGEPKWWASIVRDDIDEMSRFDDFPSAVRWLHRQAAAVDAEFVKAFPVPE
jgi:hypothetical protein